MALTKIPASKLSGTSLPSTIGIGTRIEGTDLGDITGIPSTAKMLVIGTSNLSPNSSGNDANYGIQLGTSSGFVTSGYQSNHWYIYDSSSDNQSAQTSMIHMGGWSNAGSHEIICHCYNVTGTTWTYNLMAQVDGTYAGGMSVVGGVTLGGALDRLKWNFTTGNYSSGNWSVTYY